MSIKEGNVGFETIGGIVHFYAVIKTKFFGWVRIIKKAGMDEQKAKANKWVNTITNFAEMRFSPEHVYERRTNNPRGKLVEKIKTMIPWSPRSKAQNETEEN